jgi:hypothetical protein
MVAAKQIEDALQAGGVMTDGILSEFFDVLGVFGLDAVHANLLA